jgi:ArsR family transcriptional regulator, arsenate/arsenite/antimonite-responsive transcriptional repressor
MGRRTPSVADAQCESDEPRPADRLAHIADDIADEEFAALAKALAHPIRVRIVRMLARKAARTCSCIVDELPLAQSTVSEHLRILKAAGLIRASENGLCVRYCIVPAALERVKALLDAI